MNKTLPLAFCILHSAFCIALASDSTWQGGNGNWSDANWLDSDTSTVGAFVAGSRAVVNDACTIAIDVDTPAVGGLSFGANAVIAGPGKLVMASGDKAQALEVASGVKAKISAPISGKVRKTGYGSLETTADNYKTLILSATNVDPVVFEIGTGTWIVSGGSTVHVQTPSTEGESNWYYFQGEGGSFSDPSKGAYIVVTNNSTLMYSKGKGAGWTCFGPRNKKGHFELLVTDGSTFKTKSDDFRISSDQIDDTYFKLRAVDSAIEINSVLNGFYNRANATKILEFVNSTVAFNRINMRGVATLNSVTFDGATVTPLSASENFFSASSRNGTVIYHTTGNGLTLNAAKAVTLDTEAVIDGDGGLVKTGDKTLTLAADYAYTGATRASAGTLVLSGTVVGPLAVDSGATLSVTSISQGAVPSVTVNGAATFQAVPISTASLVLGSGATLSLGTYGNVMTSVTGYENATISFDATGWPLDTALFTSSDAGFLAAMRTAIQSQLASGLEAVVENGSVFIHSANVVKEAVWTGLGTDANWSTAENWDADGAPNTGDWLRFDGSANAANTNDLGALLFQSVVFSTGSGPFEIAGEGAIAAPAWTNLSENAQTLTAPATASANSTVVHAVGDMKFLGGLGGSSAYTVFKEGAGTMVVTNADSWCGRLVANAGTVKFEGFDVAGAPPPLSEEDNGVIVAGATLDIGGASLTIRQSTVSGAEPVLKDGATLLHGTYTLAGPSGYLTTWLPGTITIGEGATLITTCQLFDNPATAGRRVLRVTDGGRFISRTDNERHLASGNTADTAFVFDIDGGTARFENWGYTYFGSRQGGRRYTEVHISNGGHLFVQSETRFGDYDGNGGSNVFTMVDSGAEFATLNAGVRVNSFLMDVRNSVITNNNFTIGNNLGATPATHSVTFDNARLVSKQNDASWLKAASNTDTACFHLASGGLTMEARHNVTVSAVMDGAGGMTKTGSGTLTLAAKQLYTGATVVSNGTLVVASGADIAGPVVVADGGTLSVADSATVFGAFTLKAGGLVSIPAFEGHSVDLFAVSGPITFEHDMYDHGKRLFIKNAQDGTRIVRYGRNPGVMIMLQ